MTAPVSAERLAALRQMVAEDLALPDGAEYASGPGHVGELLAEVERLKSDVLRATAEAAWDAASACAASEEYGADVRGQNPYRAKTAQDAPPVDTGAAKAAAIDAGWLADVRERAGRENDADVLADDVNALVAEVQRLEGELRARHIEAASEHLRADKAESKVERLSEKCASLESELVCAYDRMEHAEAEADRAAKALWRAGNAEAKLDQIEAEKRARQEKFAALREAAEAVEDDARSGEQEEVARRLLERIDPWRRRRSNLEAWDRYLGLGGR